MAEPGRAVLAVDYDGTLAPIVADPATAVPHPGAVTALTDLAGLVGTLAVVTGRPAEDVLTLAGLRGVPDLVVLGLYGEQRWESGRLHQPPPPAGLRPARAELTAILSAAGAAASGVTVEDKGSSFAVHARSAADPTGALTALRDPLIALAARHGLVVQPGRLVLELHRPGTDKGEAVRGLVAAAHARAGRPPSAVLYMGDDVGDLPAFTAVHELCASGVPAWVVAVAGADTAREAPQVAAAADALVPGPAGAVALLRAVADALRG